MGCQVRGRREQLKYDTWVFVFVLLSRDTFLPLMSPGMVAGSTGEAVAHLVKDIPCLTVPRA